MEEIKSLRGVMKRPTKLLSQKIDNAEPESYRIQVRLSAADYKRLEKEARDTCTAMSMLSSLFIHDGLNKREREKRPVGLP